MAVLGTASSRPILRGQTGYLPEWRESEQSHSGDHSSEESTPAPQDLKATSIGTNFLASRDRFGIGALITLTDDGKSLAQPEPGSRWSDLSDRQKLAYRNALAAEAYYCKDKEDLRLLCRKFGKVDRQIQRTGLETADSESVLRMQECMKRMQLPSMFDIDCLDSNYSTTMLLAMRRRDMEAARIDADRDTERQAERRAGERADRRAKRKLDEDSDTVREKANEGDLRQRDMAIEPVKRREPGPLYRIPEQEGPVGSRGWKSTIPPR